MEHTLRRDGIPGWEKRPNRHKHAIIFAALGDETRLLLVARLATGEPQSIAELTAGSRLTRQAVTKHLRVLAIAGVVRSVRAGRQNLFLLKPRLVKEVKNYLDRVSRQWDDTSAKLKTHVEG